MGYYARDGAYMHDENDSHYRNQYGEPIKTTGGPDYDERVRDSEGQRNLNRYGEPLRGATSEYHSDIKGTSIDLNKIRAERTKHESQMRQIEDRNDEITQNRREAIKIIVQEKREEYERKSWFSKTIAKLRGKSFDKMKWQITEEARQKVNSMSEDRLERFIEKEGKSR